jgi:phenylalanyl-tRNA synthetase beta subunit
MLLETVEEIDRILGIATNDDEISRILKRLGSRIDVRAVGYSSRTWLRSIKAVICDDFDRRKETGSFPDWETAK